MSEDNRANDRSDEKSPRKRAEDERKKKTGTVPPLSLVISEGGPRRIKSGMEEDAQKTSPPRRDTDKEGIPPIHPRKRVETSRVPPPPAPMAPRRRIPQAPTADEISPQKPPPSPRQPAPVRDEIGGLSMRLPPSALSQAPRVSDIAHSGPGLPEEIPPVPGMPAAPRLVQPPGEQDGEPGAPPSFLKPGKLTARLTHPLPKGREKEEKPEAPAEADSEPEPKPETAEPEPKPETGPDPEQAHEEEEADDPPMAGLPPVEEPETVETGAKPQESPTETPADEDKQTPAEGLSLKTTDQADHPDDTQPPDEQPEPEPVTDEPAPKKPEPIKFDFSKFAEQLANREKSAEDPEPEPEAGQPQAEPEPESEPERKSEPESEPEPEPEPEDEPVSTPAPEPEPEVQVVAPNDWSEDKADEAAFTISIPDRKSPYHGLQRFEEEDNDQYFGQRQLLADMLDGLDESNLLVLVGPPCSGKSSFLRAGLVPNYKELEKNAVSVTFSPGDDPYDSLARGIVRAGIRKNAQTIAREPAHYVFRRLEQKVLDDDEHWLVVLDQFEEFGRCQSEADIPRNAAFVASLVELGRRANSRIKVVISLRDDFFWKLGDYRQLAAVVDRRLYRLSDLDDKSLRQVITEPLGETEIDVEEDLVRHLISDVREQPAGLPLLQHVLDLLWLQTAGKSKQMGLDDYLRFGGLEGALRRRLETLFSSLDPGGQDALRRLLLRLIELSVPSSAIRHSFPPIPRPTRLGEITDREERKILDRLIQERIVMCSGQGQLVELPVEAYLQTWPRFRRWLQEVHEVAALRNQLREDARTWSFRMERRGPEAAAALLWKGAHLDWALELRERGELDEMGERLTDVEKRFLETSREQDPREPAEQTAPAEEATPETAPGDGIPGMTREEVEQALRELEELRRERAEARAREEAAEGMPDLPEDQREQAEAGEESADDQAHVKKVGGPAVGRRVDDDSLRESIQLSELQHEVIVRERNVKQQRYIIYGLVGLALLLFIGMISQCMKAASATARGDAGLMRPHIREALVKVIENPGETSSSPADRHFFPQNHFSGEQ